MANRQEDVYRRDLADWRKTNFVTGIDIRTSPYSCVLCHFIAGCYRLADAPTLPQTCEIEWGCTAWWTSIMNGEAPRSEWRTVDTFVDRESVGLAVAMRHCCLQIEQCVKDLSKTRIRASTRRWRTGHLKEEIARLENIDPDHPLLTIGKQCLKKLPEG